MTVDNSERSTEISYPPDFCIRQDFITPHTSERHEPSSAVTSRRSNADSQYAQYARKLAITDGLVVCCAVTAGVVLGILCGYQPTDLLAQSALGNYVVGSAILAAVWMLSLAISGSRSRRLAGRGVEEYAHIVFATLQLFGVIAISALLLGIEVSRHYLAVALVTGLVGLLFNRRQWRRATASRRRLGELRSSLLVVGSLRAATEIATTFAKDPDAVYNVLGICTPAGAASEGDVVRVSGRDIPIVGIDEAIVDAVKRTGAQCVALAANDRLQPTEIRKLIWQLDSLGVDLMIAPGLVDITGQRLFTRPVAGMAMLEVAKPQYDRANSLAKRAFDVTFAAAAVIALAPVFVLAALAVRLSGPGPILYVSERVGHNGSTFRMLKFRSMHDGADARVAAMIDGSDPLYWKCADDPRVTPVGRVLRKFSLDELPQFVNVLRGDMSIVGPRPQVRREVDTYDELVRRRLAVRPGLTGLWQVSGRSNVRGEDAIRLDLSYVENWSPITDLVIIAKTIRAVLSGHGAY